jgi:hypothetical protein
MATLANGIQQGSSAFGSLYWKKYTERRHTK